MLKPNRPRQQSGRRRHQKSLLIETLENRNLLAADVFTHADATLLASLEPQHHDHAEEIQFDSQGRAFYVDGLELDGEGSSGSDPEAVGVPAAATVPVTPIATETEVPIFHSNPTAVAKIYLDFDGQVVSNTGWNDDFGDRPITARAFDNDGDPDTFSSSELRIIERVWERVAEDYAPFTIDVTTEEPSASDLRRGSRAIRVLISTDIDETTGEQWFEGSGGVAYINSWRFRNDTPVWVFENNLAGNEKRIAEAASHEAGHAFGLSHDGIEGGTDYYEGHGSGQTGWAPIMGAGYSKQVTQWSRGDYGDGSNRQNDLSIITSSGNRVSYRADDHRSSSTQATQLVADDDGVIQANGIIGRESDRDMFVFEVGYGLLEIDVDPALRGANLDIEATLYDADLNEIAVSNPANRLDASFDIEVAGGSYYLMIDGVGTGDAESGYTDYASLGQYGIDITVPAQAEIALLAGDIDGNGLVEFQDFLILASNFQQSATSRRSGDLDGDGVVQFSDFLVLSHNYGTRQIDVVAAAAASMTVDAKHDDQRDEEPDAMAEGQPASALQSALGNITL